MKVVLISSFIRIREGAVVNMSISGNSLVMKEININLVRKILKVKNRLLNTKSLRHPG